MKKLYCSCLCNHGCVYGWLRAKTSGKPAEDAAPAAPQVFTTVNLVNGNLGDKSFGCCRIRFEGPAEAGRITYKTIEMGGTDQITKWLETERGCQQR